MFTVRDHEGTMVTTSSGEAIAAALDRGEIVRTGDPCVFRFVRKDGLASRPPTPAERRFAARHAMEVAS